MPPKSSNSAEIMPSEEDEPLQAVILADTYNERLKPLTVDQPRCLLPICNTPLLDWTLESLALAGVQEVFVVCTAHADLIKETLAASKWSRSTSGLKVTPIATDKSCFAPGEALRDVYTHGVITSDFILVFGDLVSNIRLDEVVRAHKARRRVDKDAIMTMVVKEAGAEHRTRPLGDTGVFVLDADTDECLHYEPVPGVPTKKSVRIPREALAKHRNVDVRNDLIDCGIDICSIEVPSLFQDNFDYLDIRRDFVRGILTSDLLSHTIHCHVVKDGYAARVKDTKSYDMISKDILSRWTYPLVPDENNPGGQLYEHRRGNTYIPPGGTAVRLSRSCKVGPNTLIGENSLVESDAQISRSVLGRGCVIGVGTVIKDSYLWDSVTVEEGCVIDQSIVAKGATILRGSILERGCIIGDGVKLGPEANLPDFSRVARDEPEEGGGDRSPEMLGAESNGIIWPSLGAHVDPTREGSDDEDEEEVADELETPHNLRLLRIGKCRVLSWDETRLNDIERYEPDSSSSEEEDSSDESDSNLSEAASARSSNTSLPTSSNGAFASKLTSLANAEFQREATASLDRAWAEGHAVDNAAVELKTLRMASNVELGRVREAVIVFLAGKIEAGEGEPRQKVGKVMARWGVLINAIGGANAVETIEILQRVCAREARYQGLFGLLLASFYQEDIVEEEDVRAWHAKPESKGRGVVPAILAATLEKCWAVGSRMIEQFDAQDTESEESE